MNVYNELLKLTRSMVGSETTFADELDSAGRQLIKDFQGVFASDQIPELDNYQSVIANLDPAGQPGSHWVGIAKCSRGLLIYDSFGRPSREILPGIPEYIDAESDAEQTLDESDCGARSLAWLCVFRYWGPDLALEI